MIFPGVYGINIVSVYERGVSNKERIVFKTDTWLNLCEYGVMIGLLQENGLSAPYHDQLYHFKELYLLPNSWIFLYTGPGNDYSGNMPNDNSPFHVFHWGKPTTVFAHSLIIPILFQIGAVQLGSLPKNLPQLEGSN